MVMSLGCEGVAVYIFVVRPNTDVEKHTYHIVINIEHPTHG